MNVQNLEESSDSSPLYKSEPEPSVWRGVFSPNYHRKVIFSKKIKIKMADLPRWKPYIS